MAIDTEFICEVVKITELKVHPGADRLLVAHFATKEGPTDYTTIVPKDSNFREGQLAIFYGVDCLCPLYPPPPGLSFLVAGTSRSFHRVKAARLRGIYSEGILVPLDKPRSLGDSVAEEFAVTQYVRAEPGPAFPMGKNIPKARNLHWPDYKVDSLKKAPFLFQDGEQVTIHEKIHGTNVRCAWYKGQFVVGSHHTIKTDVRSRWSRFVDWLWRRPQRKGFYDGDVWTTTLVQHGIATKIQDYPNYIFYGEIYGPGIQDLTYDAKESPQVRFFDVYSLDEKRYLSQIEVNVMLFACNLPTPPVLFEGDYPGLEYIKKISEGKSDLAHHTKEGVVVSSYAKRCKGKYVGQGYLLRKGG